MGEPDGADEVGLGTLVPARRPDCRPQERRVPRYQVVLWDSDAHTYEYVERMLRELCGHSLQQCHQLAEQVDSAGRAVVLTTTWEHAELKRDQIHAYGGDQMLSSRGSMWATIETAD